MSKVIHAVFTRHGQVFRSREVRVKRPVTGLTLRRMSFCAEYGCRLLKLPEDATRIRITVSRQPIDDWKPVRLCRELDAYGGYDPDLLNWFSNGPTIPREIRWWLNRHFPDKYWGHFYIRVDVLRRAG